MIQYCLHILYDSVTANDYEFLTTDYRKPFGVSPHYESNHRPYQKLAAFNNPIPNACKIL